MVVIPPEHAFRFVVADTCHEARIIVQHAQLRVTKTAKINYRNQESLRMLARAYRCAIIVRRKRT
jgi:hypothetical protein